MRPGAGPSSVPTRPRSVTGWSAALLCAVFTLSAAAQEESGQTPRPKDAPPPKDVPESELVRLDKDLPYFKSVEDPGPFIYRGEKLMDARRQAAAEAELKAYDYVLAFAHRQPAERLRQFSAKGVPVENLFRPIREDYLRELLHVEGKLALVSAMQPTEGLKDLAGITQLYEAWVFAKGTNKLVCLVVPELPAGVSPGEDQTAWVAFDAYYFKLFHYESRRPKDKADSDKHQWERAPLFLGKTFEVVAGPPPEEAMGGGVMAGVVGGVAALLLAGVGLALYFRRGDRQVQVAARQKIESQATFENDPSAGPVNRLTDPY